MALVAHGGGAAFEDPNAGPKKNMPEAVEMLEFCKSLDIDPVKESEMLWIAEEAVNAPLPLGWSEHTDGHGHTYFHNIATGKSAWQHPMDDMYRKVVEYYRTVLHVGGFWTVEDDIAAEEERIRNDLGDWMELFDAQGDKYYYNRRTEESRFDDPRNEMYHSLYERIKMVAKMKERLPLLARAPRPDEPTPYEVRLQRLREQEEQQFMRSVIRIQCLSRMFAAKRRLRKARDKRELGRGPQPLRGRLRLRLEAVGPEGQKDLVLGETTPHKRARMAARIQARVRGVQARERLKPLKAHEEHRIRALAKIQKPLKTFLAKKRAEREAIERLHRAATTIQKVHRGIQGRLYVKRVRYQRRGFELIRNATIKIQCLFRQVKARSVLRLKKAEKYSDDVEHIQGAIKMRKARHLLNSYLPAEEPVQVRFCVNTDDSSQGVLPFTLQVWMAPTDPDSGKLLKPPRVYHNMFREYAPDNYVAIAGATLVRVGRGFVSRIRLRRAKEEAIRAAARELARRTAAAIYIQKIYRGWSVRFKRVLFWKRLEWVKRCTQKITIVQAQMKKWVAKKTMFSLAATMIQQSWRGFLARRLHDKLAMEALWPVNGFFDYTATGPSSVFITAQFFHNPRFDAHKFFMFNGGGDYLMKSLDDMKKEVTVCVDNYLASIDWKPPEEEKRRKKGADGEGSQEGSEEGSTIGSQEDCQAGSKAGSKAGSSRGGSASGSETASSGTRSVASRRSAGSSKSGRDARKSEDEAKAERKDASEEDTKEIPAPAATCVCGSDFFPDAIFCRRCGEKRPGIELCTCGSVFLADALFCRTCGSKRILPEGFELPPLATGSVEAAPAGEEPVGNEAGRTGGEAAAAAAAPASAAQEASPLEALLLGLGEEDSGPSPMAAFLAAQEPSEASEPTPAALVGADAAVASGAPATPDQTAATEDSGLAAEAAPTSEDAAVDAPEGPSEVTAETTAGTGAADGEEATQEPSTIDQTATGIPSPDRSASPLDATTRPPGVGEPGHEALAVLAGAAADAEAEQEAVGGPTHPPDAPRKHYAGTYHSGKFARTKAQNIDDLSEDDRKQVLADLEESRRQKVEELMRRQKKRETKLKKQQRKEAADLSKGQELKKWMKLRDEEVKAQKAAKEQEQLAHMMARQKEQAVTAEKYARRQDEQIYRRLRVAEDRKAKIADVMQHGGRQSGPYPGQSGPYPVQGQPSPQVLQAQRMLHRHIHHHMHYRSGGPMDESMRRTSDSNDTQLPALPPGGIGVAPGFGAATTQGPVSQWAQSPHSGAPLRGMRRVNSDGGGFKGAVAPGGVVGPRQKMLLTQSTSAGHLLQPGAAPKGGLAPVAGSYSPVKDGAVAGFQGNYQTAVGADLSRTGGVGRT